MVEIAIMVSDIYLTMTDSAFKDRVADLMSIAFREDFLTALCDLYQQIDPVQRDFIRTSSASGLFGAPKPWKNPADYDRSDLTREHHVRETLLRMSIDDGSNDYRDDLISIAYCYHNLAVRGIDADRVLLEIAAISASKVSGLLTSFVKREPWAKSLEAWRLKVEQTPDGPVVDHML